MWQNITTRRTPRDSLTCPRKAPSISAPLNQASTILRNRNMPWKMRSLRKHVMKDYSTIKNHQLNAIGGYTSISCSWIIFSSQSKPQKMTQWNFMRLHGTTVVSYTWGGETKASKASKISKLRVQDFSRIGSSIIRALQLWDCWQQQRARNSACSRVLLKCATNLRADQGEIDQAV